MRNTSDYCGHIFRHKNVYSSDSNVLYSVHECVGALRAVDNEWAQNEAKRLEILYGKEIILEAEGEISALN